MICIYDIAIWLVSWRWSWVSFGYMSTAQDISIEIASQTTINLNPLNIDRTSDSPRTIPRVVLWLAYSASLLFWAGRLPLVVPLQLSHAIQSMWAYMYRNGQNAILWSMSRCWIIYFAFRLNIQLYHAIVPGKIVIISIFTLLLGMVITMIGFFVKHDTTHLATASIGCVCIISVR